MSLKFRHSVSADASSSPRQGTHPRNGSRIPLPPAGPAWFPSVMGTGLLSNLLYMHASHLPGAHVLSAIVLGIAWLLLIGLTCGFIFRVARKPGAMGHSVKDFSSMPFWATVSMGYLSVGSASTVVIPSFLPELSGLVWTLNTGMWLFGTAVGVGSTFGFAVRLIGVDRGSPTTIWGLAVVAPWFLPPRGRTWCHMYRKSLTPTFRSFPSHAFFYRFLLVLSFLRAHITINGG